MFFKGLRVVKAFKEFKGLKELKELKAGAEGSGAQACKRRIYAAKACAGTKIIATCKLKKLKRLPG